MVQHFFLLPEHQDILVESSWAACSLLQFPSVRGPCSRAWQGCAECLPPGLEGPIHTFCQAKAGQLRCRRHQSRSRLNSHAPGPFEASWAAVVLQGCVSCPIRRCHRLRLCRRGGRVCPAQSWLSSQCCCVTVTPQCLSFPTCIFQTVQPVRPERGDKQRDCCSSGHPHVSPPVGMAPELQTSSDALRVGCRGRVACSARSTASWSPAVPCSPTWPARGPCSSPRWAARTSTPPSSSMTSPGKATPTSTTPTAAPGWRGEGCRASRGQARRGGGGLSPGARSGAALVWLHVGLAQRLFVDR